MQQNNVCFLCKTYELGPGLVYVHVHGVRLATVDVYLGKSSQRGLNETT